MDYDDSRLRKFIGELLLKERKRIGLSQDSFAKKLGMKTETLRHIEKGHTSARMKYLCKLFLELFGFDLENFIIKYYFNKPNDNDYATLPWQKQLAIDLTYRQINHDQICYLIIDHLKHYPLNKTDKTPQQIHRKKRSKEMDRRSTLLGLTGGVFSGQALSDKLQGWLLPFDKNTEQGRKNLSSEMGKLGDEHLEMLRLSAQKLYESHMRYGGNNINRRLAVTLLHEVSVALQEKQASMIQLELFKIMASLADTVAWLSWHDGLESSTHSYYLLALRAAHAAEDRLFGANVLVGLALQMHYLAKPQEMLRIMKIAHQSCHNMANPQIKAMLYMHEAWAYATLGQVKNYQYSIGLAEDNMMQVEHGHEPFWLSYCDQSELAAMTGGGLRLLAMHKPTQYAEKASELNAKAIELRNDCIHSYTAQDYCGLAQSRFLLKDIELAIDASHKALDIYSQLQHRCGSTRRRLHDLYQYSNQPSKARKLQALNFKLKSALAIA